MPFQDDLEGGIAMDTVKAFSSFHGPYPRLMRATGQIPNTSCPGGLLWNQRHDNARSKALQSLPWVSSGVIFKGAALSFQVFHADTSSIRQSQPAIRVCCWKHCEEGRESAWDCACGSFPAANRSGLRNECGPWVETMARRHPGCSARNQSPENPACNGKVEL
jgi:hypothetical protein